MSAPFDESLPIEDSHDLLDLLTRRKARQFEKDQIIFSRHSPPEGLYLLVEGVVKLSRVSEDGLETVIDVVTNESFFGASSLLQDLELGDRAVALQKSQIMLWRSDELNGLLLRSPKLSSALIKLLVQELVKAEDRIDRFANDNIVRRLIKALLHFAETLGVPEPDGTLRIRPLTHELLSRYVGTSREIITMHLNQLRKKGAVVYSRAGLQIYPDKLREELTAAGPKLPPPVL